MQGVFPMTNDPIRDALWSRVYAAALERKVIWFEAKALADDAVRRYDQRPTKENNNARKTD